MNINFEEKFDMVEDLWITIQTLKFYKPERGTHEFFHVSDTINWAEGKINLLFESAKNQYKEKIKELEAKEKQYKDQVEELHRDKDRIRQAQLKTFEEINEQLEADGLYQEDDYENIPEIAAPMEIVIKETPVEMPEVNIPSVTLNEEEKSSQGNSTILKPLVIPKIELKADNSGVLEQIEIAEKFLKSYKPEKAIRPIPEAKRKQIEEGIIKFFRSKGKKTSFKYNFGQASKPESIKEAKEIQSLCQTTNHNFIKQVFKSLLSSGRIMETGVQKKRDGSFGGGRFVLYSLNDLEYTKAKSLCPKCGGFSLVKNENKYSSDEDYYHDKNGCYYTCLTCGEEVGYTEKEAA